ncbi:pitrilysin family protein [Halobacteriovorax sp. JY17]|uniref:M16 family metallopeptidase n=1 Tax=Halobacteriovorax sp. JY17 TaxID=2014617 RepID=UPI000C3A0F9C|nr:pitrilysin family protein [Halobacteriovorax sp. JY17]PIK15328.1 MAG: hypothetical protein CES88_01035 [Halobacteriovorax sp. JY17]
MKVRTLKLLLLICSFSLPGYSFGFGKDRIKKLNWNGIEVTWLEDNRFPTYQAMIHFADGSLSDHPKRLGETSMMFDLIDSGTRRYSQKDISDNLEYFGASWGAFVTHESTVFEVSGLAKDMSPTMKKICHLFRDASFTGKEMDKYKRALRNAARSVVNNHSLVASNSFRELSLAGTPYSYPVGGKIKDLNGIHTNDLKRKLSYFNTKVKKKVYITGPESILGLESIIEKDCGWKGAVENYERVLSYEPKKPSKSPEIYLVTVPKANQAQVRLGRFLNEGEFENQELNSLSSEFLGGGFTSKLMREIRVKRGLSYTASAFAGGQRQYGRSVISTFTKVKTVKELLEVVRNVLNDIKNNGIDEAELNKAKGALAGSFPFRFERSSAYLQQLMHLDDIHKSYESLYHFPNVVRAFKEEDVRKNLSSLFSWENQTIVIVGPKSLAKELKEFGKVKVVDYKTFF